MLFHDQQARLARWRRGFRGRQRVAELTASCSSDERIVSHRHDFEKRFCQSGIFRSTCPLQAGGRNPHGDRLIHQLDENNDPLVAIGHLVDGFQSHKRAISQHDPLT